MGWKDTIKKSSWRDSIQKEPEKAPSPTDFSISGLEQAAVNSLPALGGIGGGILGSSLGPAGSVGGAGLGYAAGNRAKDLANEYLLGNKVESVGLPQKLVDTGKDIATGAALDAGGQVSGKILSKAAETAAPVTSDIRSTISNYLRNKAGALAENATGATAAQANKFREGAGNQLLDKGLIKAGDTAENIASRVGKASEDATNGIDTSLQALKDNGAKIKREDILQKIDDRISELKKDPSQSEAVRKLSSIREDVLSGDANPDILAAEQTKRGFQKQAGNWMNPEQGQAGKEAYGIYKNAVEDSATASDPSLADKFKESKDTFGLLAPIKEAAEKRALQQNQSPIGGLLDTSAIGAGIMTGNPIAGIAAPIARRVVAPRIASTSAVAIDKVSKMLAEAPETLGQYAPVLQKAKDEGGNKFAVTYFLLGQQDPHFQQLMKKAN